MTVGGFKSIGKPLALPIGGLTVLAGTNSSGKSSFLQPLLLLKQTLESSYDPGSLLLNGANARFTSPDQIQPKLPEPTGDLSISITLDEQSSVDLTFTRLAKRSLGVSEMGIRKAPGLEGVRLSLGMELERLREVIAERLRSEGPHPMRPIGEETALQRINEARWTVFRDRVFLRIGEEVTADPSGSSLMSQILLTSTLFQLDSEAFGTAIRSVIHVPGVRGNADRSYPRAAVGDTFVGTFENYTASVVESWQADRAGELAALASDLQSLGLTWKVAAQETEDSRVELVVGRTPRPRRGGARDLVSIADVGIGVSQVLPVLVALRVARWGQLVYIEQPEMHLHPRAQVTLAAVFAEAAQRGVQVVVETHSSALLLGLQTLVAEGTLDRQLVKLHWFSRDAQGRTQVSSAALDESGAFGEWPVDFDDVLASSQDAYLTAAYERLKAKAL